MAFSFVCRSAGSPGIESPVAYSLLKRLSGFAAKHVSVPIWQMTTYVVRWLQPSTPTVYSTRCTPFTQGPCTAGWI